MRLKGVKQDGTPRYRHRVGHGCQARPAALPSDEAATTALDVRGETFRADFYDPGKGYNLAALWRAKGRPETKRPADWFRTEEGRAWESVVRDQQLTAPGPTGGTWIDDIQAALQYAAYLDPALREDIYDVYVRRNLSTAPRQSSLWHPTEPDMRALVRSEVDEALRAHEQRIKSITITETEVIERPVDGRVYIAEASAKVLQISTNVEVLRRFNQGWRYFYISQSGRGEDERLAEYEKKTVSGVPAPKLCKVILSDRRKALETALHKSLPAGVWKVPGKRDEFMVSPEATELLLTLPSYIASVDIPRVRGWAVCMTIFDKVSA